MESAKNICVYCGSSNNASDEFKSAASNLGKILAENDIGLVYGGGQVGLMGVVADSVMKHGGHTTGFIPQHLHETEVGHKGISELVIVNTMHERKRLMYERSDAFVVLAGGFGTLDEICEILTWKQLRLHNKPIIFIDTNKYWSPLFDTFVANMIKETFVRPEHREFYKIIPSPDSLLDTLNEMPLDTGPDLVSRWW
ncbi:MAG: TIGR00730 family Rossman fold protein [Alphaproteobacteria bacterium]